jgi:4-hydroxy-tetrahydrodipicolinate synthase
MSGEKISVCTGIDSQFYPTLCAGGKGIFSTAACVIPKQMVQIYDLTRDGKHDEAFKVHMKIQNLNRLLEYDPGYVSPCKEALRMMALPGGRVRKPLPDLTPDQREELKAALEELNLL